MAQSRRLVARRRKLGEIRDIMNSMKSLAFMEFHRLARFGAAQREVVRAMEAAAAVLLAGYPEIEPRAGGAGGAYLMIGSERGFCGDFNDALLARAAALAAERGDARPRLIAVGRKLCARLEGDARLAAALEGATVAGEAEAVLQRVVARITALQREEGPLSVTVLYHGGEDGALRADALLPPFQAVARTAPAAPPLLNLAPRAMFAELSGQYLLAALHAVIYDSLLAENTKRIQHLEGALHRLDEQTTELARKYHAQRQEEITEEIEVILLSARGAPRHR